MHAALVFQPLENVLAADVENDSLEAAEVGWAGIQCLQFPPARFRVAAIHPVKVGGEQRRLRTARAGADFNDGVARVSRVRQHEAALDFKREAFFLRAEPRDFFLRHLRELRVARLGLEQLAIRGEVGPGFQVGRAVRDEFLQPRIFLRQFLKALVVGKDFGVVQCAFDLSQPFGKSLNMRTQIHVGKKYPPAEQ